MTKEECTIAVMLNVQQILKFRNTTLTEFAREAGISRSLLYRYCVGERTLNIYRVWLFAKHLKVPIGEILEGL